jgi:cysteinyl-tRNA synthetase, unknown class
MARVLTLFRRLFILTVVSATAYLTTLIPAPRSSLPAREGVSLANVRSWGYQLQDASSDRIASSIDMLVIDSQISSSQFETLSFDAIQRFKQRPDGTQRLVLAYLSVGEAETYRFYWQSHWKLFAPSWLGPENNEWKGNFRVRFWETGWQNLIVVAKPTLLDRGLERIMPARQPYLDRILDAGFDGVYLDRVDAYYEWQKTRPGSEAAMIALVTQISTYAKARKPGFLVIPQNAEELLTHSHYRRQIDAIAKEDLFFGASHKEQANAANDVADSLALLNRIRLEKKPIFVVEYLTEQNLRSSAKARATTQGYILHFAQRALKSPPEPLFQLEAPSSERQPTGLPAQPARPKG